MHSAPAAKSHATPEDVGGSLGYEKFLKALVDPQHPEHAEMKEWIGHPFDPRAFDIDEVNARLGVQSRLFGLPPVSRTPCLAL